MEEKNKKYGLWSGIAMVVGIVIGAGIFIKSGNVLKECGGNIYLALVAWLVGGVIMIAGAFCFAKFATKITKFDGLIDYIEVSSNKRFAYYVAYFMGMIYYPIVCSCLAIFGSQFLLAAMGIRIDNPWIIFAMTIAFLTFFFLLNYLSPYLADKFQISSMVIKLIPIFILVIVSLFGPLIQGVGSNLSTPFIDPTPSGYVTNFGNAIKITSFTYNGWVCVTSINADMKDSKKNLPRALVGGTIAIMLFYILFFIGIATVIGKANLINCDAVDISKETAAGLAFAKFMGLFGPTLMLIFICISCLGNVNGLMLCGSRSQIAMAVRHEGFIPDKINKIHNNKYSIYSYLIQFGMSIVFAIIATCARSNYPDFKYLKTIDDVVCSLMYIVYAVIYIYIIKYFKELNIFERYVVPIVAIAGSAFIAFCGTGLYEMTVDHTYDSIIGFAILFLIGLIIFIPAEWMWRKNHKEQVA